jgi:hypothetical protein
MKLVFHKPKYGIGDIVFIKDEAERGELKPFQVVGIFYAYLPSLMNENNASYHLLPVIHENGEFSILIDHGLEKTRSEFQLLAPEEASNFIRESYMKKKEEIETILKSLREEVTSCTTPTCK